MMTPKERAVMQQALEALEEMFHSNSTKVAVEKYNTAHNALREVLAEQAEQEPVAVDDEKLIKLAVEAGFEYRDSDERLIVRHSNGSWVSVGGQLADFAALITAPVRTKDLTDDEIMKINVDTASIVPTCDRQFHFARAVIAADREKNRG